MPGFVSESEKKEILEKSWILVNTSIHEGLPQTFIEACAYKCALLSSVNPDDFASKFGYHVKNDDFENGLMWLLNDDNWKIKGREGYEYVKRVNALERVIERRIAIYKALMDDDPRKVEEIAKSSVEEPL
jgi:glycosyltransferase involved in cell wall biosynthesis